MSATTDPVRKSWTCPKCQRRQPRGSVRHQNGHCAKCDAERLRRTRRRTGPPIRNPDIAVAELAARAEAEAHEAAAAAAEAARLRERQIRFIASLMTGKPRGR